MERQRDGLARMSDVDYEVAPGEPDVRGWDVVLGNDEKIGTVHDLIIDRAVDKVRYLDVDVDRRTAGTDRDRHLLVPIDNAQLDTEEKDVVLSGLSRDALLKLPDYDGQADRGPYDERFRSQLSDDHATKRVTRSAEELRIGRRAAKAGEVRVGKHVETEHVTENVPLRREEVHVERRPVEHAVGSAAEFRNDEIVVPVMEEEAVVEKRPVVKEEIVISKETVTEERPVEADVRHEEFDVKPSSGDVRVRGDVKGRGGE